MRRLYLPLFCLALILAAGCTDYEKSYIPCTTDEDCVGEPGTICINNECREAPTCQTDAECGADRICEGGTCTAAECHTDTDCAGVMRCEALRCVEAECLDSSNCDDGYHCEEYVCVQDECLTNGDCAYDEICEDGQCVQRVETPCEEDADCLDDELCIQGFCQVPPPCDDDLDCPGSLVCVSGTCAHPCVDAATDCPPNHDCVAGHCYKQCFGDQFCTDPDYPICEDGHCVPAECENDEDCDGELVRCVGGRCEPYTPCVDDSDCTEPHYLCLEGICEELPTCAIDQDCETELMCQEIPCVCKDDHCYQVATCETEADCAADEDCIGGLCLPHICRGPTDCDPGYICVAGVCVLDENPANVDQVVILTPGGPIHQDQQIALEAVALTADGTAVPGVVFDWASTEPNRAAVDAAGVLTGGSEAGATDVTATAVGTAVTSLPTTFTNFPDATVDEIRVIVVLAHDRTPLEGVTVVMDDGSASTEAATDAAGVATFTDPGGAVDIHVFSDEHDYLSVLGTISKDILVPLNKRSDYSMAGGLKGQMTWPPGGSVSIGMAGTSIGGCLVDLNLQAFLGELFTVTVEVPGVITFDLPLPSRMVAKANVIVQLDIKTTYYSDGYEGLRSVWGMGGNLDMELAEIYELVNGIDSIEQILGKLLPYFAVFDHAVIPTFTVTPVPLVVDGDDIDGDGDNLEMRPDWTNFPTRNLEPTQTQDLAVEVTAPDLPTHGGVPVSTAVYIAGSLSSLGFTPLGLTAEEATDGVVSPLMMKLAPVYGGLEAGRYTMLVLGFPTEQQTDELPADVAMVVYSDWNLPTNVTFASNFLDFPEDATYTVEERRMAASGVTGATLFRSTIQGALGKWEVYIDSSSIVAFTLPQVPAGMDDLALGEIVTMDPIALEQGTGFEDLVTFNGDDLDQMNRLATAFTRHEL